MNLVEKLELVEKYFKYAIDTLKSELELIQKLQELQNPLLFIGNEYEFHFGELIKQRNCLSYTIERVLIPLEKSENKMILKFGEEIIEEPCAQIEVSIPKPEVVLGKCIEGKNQSEWMFAGYPKKIVGIDLEDYVLTLPHIAERITDNREYIEKCRDMQNYLEKINLPKYYENYFGKRPW